MEQQAEGTSIYPIPSQCWSLRKNFDHLETITSTEQLQDCSCVPAITESWLTSNITDSQVNIDNYTLFRSDRQSDQSGKTTGSGLSLYINNKWANSMTLLSTRIERSLETMAVKV